MSERSKVRRAGTRLKEAVVLVQRQHHKLYAAISPDKARRQQEMQKK